MDFSIIQRKVESDEAVSTISNANSNANIIKIRQLKKSDRLIFL